MNEQPKQNDESNQSDLEGALLEDAVTAEEVEGAVAEERRRRVDGDCAFLNDTP